MDLTSYGASPYGEGGPARNQQQNKVSAALRGVLGMEEPGSVLDPATAGLKAVNDKTQLASILTDLLPGKAALTGAKGAMVAGQLIPVIRGFNKDTRAAGDLLRRVTKAEDLLRQGATPEEILAHPEARLRRNLGVIRGVEPRMGNASWLHEINLDPTKELYNPAFKDPATGRPYASDDIYDAGMVYKNSLMGHGEGAYDELFRQYPQLLNTGFRHVPAGSPNVKQVQGNYSPTKKLVQVMPHAEDFEKTAFHEMSHDIMDQAKQYQNAGYGMHPNRPEMEPVGRQLYENMNDPEFMAQYLDEINDPALATYLKRSLVLQQQPTISPGWRQSTGEYLADLAGERDAAALRGLPLPENPSRFPQGPHGLIPDSVSSALNRTLHRIPSPDNVDPSKAMRTLLDELRGRGALIKPSVADAPSVDLRNKYDFKLDPDDLSMYVYKKGEKPKPFYENTVAGLGIERGPGGKFYAEDLKVDKNHQKQGLATEIYQQMLDAGFPLTKSNDVTAQGERMWASWHRRGLAKDNTFIGKKKE